MGTIQKNLPKPATQFSGIDCHNLKKTYTEHSKLITLPKNCGLFVVYDLPASHLY